MLPMVGSNILQFFSIVSNLYFTAKFNCTVPGTLYDFIEECTITTTTETPPPTNITIRTSFGIILLASVISGVAIAIIILTVIMCIVIKFKVLGRNSQQNTPSSTVKTESINIIPQEKSPGNMTYNCMNQYMCAYSIHIEFPEVSANIQDQDQEGSSQEVPSRRQYINLDPDHCHPMKNPAYTHVFD